MDLRTESLDFNVFQLFICLFLTADRPSPHAPSMETNHNHTYSHLNPPADFRVPLQTEHIFEVGMPESLEASAIDSYF